VLEPVVEEPLDRVPTIDPSQRLGFRDERRKRPLGLALRSTEGALYLTLPPRLGVAADMDPKLPRI
jgi:hypothetical protein